MSARAFENPCQLEHLKTPCQPEHLKTPCQPEHLKTPCQSIKNVEPPPCSVNRRFPEITGKDNLTVLSYSGRVKSPEWRWQRRRADLRHFEIFRHGPITIYTRLPARGTYYPICTFPASNECLFGISDAFSAFCLWVSVIFPTCSLNVPPTKACLLCATPAGMDLYIYIQVHARRLLPSAVPWISEDRLFSHCRRLGKFLS